MNEEKETTERILTEVLNKAIEAFNLEVADYDLYIGYDFKIMLFPKYDEAEEKSEVPMIEVSATNKGNFI